MLQLKPKGSYVSQNDSVLMPGVGATQAEADALNACANARLAASGSAGAPISALNSTPSAGTAASGSMPRIDTRGGPSTGAVAAPQTPTYQTAPAPAAPSRAPAPRASCSVTLSGGSGYACTGN
ncbi:hypothetical protein HOY34_02480 [Xinfangfangia sp. D13-10-4-6]|uniref:hypothetical protein n=1 Tax=Pseudogemmobacter hezensis TaxID=2737662 RepID=UPI001555BC7A|nr:hypothetical protein [Pseudogemmobacter hezensis]NPD14064.1 hypothetical protein [Pseudogemmobacter hezensis]